MCLSSDVHGCENYDRHTHERDQKGYQDPYQARHQQGPAIRLHPHNEQGEASANTINHKTAHESGDGLVRLRHGVYHSGNERCEQAEHPGEQKPLRLVLTNIIPLEIEPDSQCCS